MPIAFQGLFIYFILLILMPCAIIIIHRSLNHGPTLAVIQCPSVQRLKSGVRVLDDFPCVTIPSNARDNQYQVVF